MPRGQPFTVLCRQLAQLAAESRRADLHLHTTHSDGVWTPAEVVRRVRQRSLGAIAITDHDTCSALPEARAAAGEPGPPLEIIPGVEITCDYRGRELHLLAYFLDADEPALAKALAGLRESRRERFQAMIGRMSEIGLTVDAEELSARLNSGHALGRRDLAAMLVRSSQVQTIAEAFARYLRDGGPAEVPKRRLPVSDAIALVRGAGGVSSWAHPPPSIDPDQVAELREMGLGALEAVYPTFTSPRSRYLRELARAAGLAITGGSDCHGPTPTSRAIGSWGLRSDELEALRKRSSLALPMPQRV